MIELFLPTDGKHTVHASADGVGGDLSAASHDRVDPEHRIYPYLLRGVAIVRPNQVNLPRYSGTTDKRKALR